MLYKHPKLLNLILKFGSFTGCRVFYELGGFHALKNQTGNSNTNDLIFLLDPVFMEQTGSRLYKGSFGTDTNDLIFFLGSCFLQEGFFSGSKISRE